MKKMLSALIFASLFILVGSSAYAEDDDCSCNDFSCSSSSSHERFDGGTFVGTQNELLFQYILEPDGTAYWNQIGFLFSMVPQVGSWEIKKDHVLLTTIGFGSIIGSADSTDVGIAFGYIRTTQKLKIRNEHTLELKHIVRRGFSTDQDPLKGKGVVIDNLKPKIQLKRVKVNPADLKDK